MTAVTYYNKICCTHTERRLRSPLLWSLVVHLALVAGFYLSHDAPAAPQEAITVEMGALELPTPAAGAPASAPAPPVPDMLPSQPLPRPVPQMVPQAMSQMIPQMLAQGAPMTASRGGTQIVRPTVPLPSVSNMRVMPHPYLPGSSGYSASRANSGAAPYHPYSSSR